MRNKGSLDRNRTRRERFELLLYVGLITPTILGLVGGRDAQAGQLTASAFQSYPAANFATIQPGPFALYTVNVGGIRPTQLNEGFTEVGKKAAGFDLLAPSASALQANLLTAIEPVVIGPGGQLFVTDGHHTFTALENSVYGASNPTVFVNVVANYSNLTTAQFFAALQSQNLLLPLNDGVAVPVNSATGAPIPANLTSLTSDPYRGLEYSILKQKSSKLFTTTANITGTVGASTPGLDKMTGFYSDFLEADAYRNANGGRGLPFLSPGDIALATQWNLTGTSTTTLPNIAGTVTAAQLPGFILANSIVNNTVISNATLANGALDGNGTFTGITTINAGTPAQPITIGTPNIGFVLQVGGDKGGTVTLGGANTYTGGTSLLAGTLIIASEASLGAAATGGAIDAANVKSSVQAANGIVFNSLTEGNAILTIGTTPGNGASTFSTNRPIAVSGEIATININGYLTTLTGPIASFGSNGIGLGNATGESDLTIDDNASNKGVLTLSTPSPLFYGNLIIGNTNAPTVRVTNDAALGNTTGPAASIGQVDLNGGTFQAGASFNALERNFFLGSGSNFDVNGLTTTFGSLTDTQRTLDIVNSNATIAGAVTFSNLTISATPTLQLAGGAAGETVTLTNGIARMGNDTLIIQPTSATSLGTTEKLFSGVGAASLVNGIAPAYLVTNNGGAKSVGPYDFVTYGANGYVKATYTATTLTNTPTSVVALAANATPVGNVSAFALNTEGKTITLGAASTLTLGDGTNSSGLILATGSAINGGTLAFGASEGIIWLGGTNPTISSKITGSNGLTFAGSGGVTLSSAAAVSGPITIDSGSVTLSGANIFATNTSGILLDNVKKSPAPSTLAITANNTLAALNSVGNNSAVTLGNGAVLTLGNTTNNLSSTLSSTITQAGAATLGALTFNGTGLFDLSGGKTTLVAGSTVVVNNSAQLRLAAGAIGSNFGITLNGTSELQLAQNGGGQLANTITGTGDLRLIGGTLQITSTNNTYSGGTFVETGSILDITTANLPAINPNITNAGGLVVFDQTTNGTYAGVISDGKELGTGPMLQGSLDKDDSTGGNTGNVTLAKAQTFTGATTVEAGTLTLGAVDTLAASSGVDLGRVGGGATATLALTANNTIQALTSEASNTTAVVLGANTLTINTAATTNAAFGGVIGGSGAVVKSGAGTEVFTGANTYSGGTTVGAGVLMVNGGGTLGATTGALTVSGGTLDLGATTQTTGALTLAGGTIQDGTLVASSFGVQAGAVGAVLAGTGALTKTTTGVVLLNGANTYNGGTTIAAGTLQLGNGGTTGSILGNVVDAGALVFDHSDSEIFAGTISGTGIVAQVGAGNTTLSAANSYAGGTALIAGTLTVGNNSALGTGTLAMAAGTTLAFATGSNFTIANPVTLSGDPTIMSPTSQTNTMTSVIADGTAPGFLDKTGGGTLVLTANNTYTGGTSVDAGTLLVNGSIASSSGVTVAQGATLGGSGTLPSIAVGSGTLAPGATAGAIGTLTVLGNVAFTNASTYAVTVSPGAASLTNVAGTATLAGTLAATFQGGSYLSRRYTVLAAAGGVTGTFGALTSTNIPAGFRATLEYDANDAILDLTTTMSSAGLNGNQRAVASGLNAAFTAGAALPPAFVTVFGQTGASLASTLSQLSGEGIVAAQGVAHRESALFTSTITDQTTFYGDIGDTNSITLTEAAPGFLAYTPQRELADLPSRSQETLPLPPRQRTWRAWATGYGGTEDVHGDSGLGSNGLTSTIYGGSLGVDYQLSPNYRAGIAVGGSDGSFNLPTLATSGSTTGGHIAFYDLATFGAFYAASSNSFSYYTNKTTRTAVADTERGTFDSHEFRTRVEFGRHVDVYGAVLTPFVALDIAELRSNGFIEKTLTGPGVFGLSVQGQSVASVPATVGARWQQKAVLGNGMVFAPSVQIAYVHEFAPERSQIAGFAVLPGSTFLVNGARPDRDAAQIKIGGQLGITPASALFASFDSELSGHAQFYGGKGGFKYVW